MFQTTRVEFRQLRRLAGDFAVVQMKPVRDDLPETVSIRCGVVKVQIDFHTVIENYDGWVKTGGSRQVNGLTPSA